MHSWPKILSQLLHVCKIIPLDEKLDIKLCHSKIRIFSTVLNVHHVFKYFCWYYGIVSENSFNIFWNFNFNFLMNITYSTAERLLIFVVKSLISHFCLSDRPSICRQHGFQSIISVLFGIWNIICTFPVSLLERLLIWMVKTKKNCVCWWWWWWWLWWWWEGGGGGIFMHLHGQQVLDEPSLGFEPTVQQEYSGGYHTIPSLLFLRGTCPPWPPIAARLHPRP